MFLFLGESEQEASEAVHADLKTAIELQQVDLRIAALTSQIEGLPSQIQTIETELRDFLHTYEDRKLRLSANQRERRELDGEVQLIQTKISRHKDQLYQVKTNEQYKAMLREIETEEANIEKIEDRILDKMIEAEQLEKHLKDAASRLESEKARVATETRRLEALRQSDEQERSQLLERRQGLEATLSSAVRDLYQRIRKARRGVALAEVRDGFCTGCNVRLRPQVYNEVRANESLLTCETCNRILYYVQQLPSESEAAPDPSARTNGAALRN